MFRLAFIAALLGATAAHAEQRCTTRPAVGGGTITSCSSNPSQQYRTRDAVGGGTITTGAGRTCTARPAVGGGVLTTCR